MDIKTVRVAIGKRSMMAFVMLWATVAIAGMNEDLIEASKRGDLPEVKRLLTKGADVNAKDRVGGTALMDASARGHREVVQLLLAKGADVNAKDLGGGTALTAASDGGHQEIQELLIKAGAK